MKIETLLWLILLALITGCGNDLQEEQKNYVIEFGTRCGRCAGTEWITITPETVSYERNIPCGTQTGITKKQKQLTENEWNSLSGSFNLETFQSLKFNECHSCYDGCDEILKVTVSDSTHTLTYMPTARIKGIEGFQGQLYTLLAEMQKR